MDQQRRRMVEINQWVSAYLLSAIYVTMSGELVKPSVSLRRCLALSYLSWPCRQKGTEGVLCVCCVLLLLAMLLLHSLVLHLWAVLLLGTTNATPW